MVKQSAIRAVVMSMLVVGMILTSGYFVKANAATIFWQEDHLKSAVLPGEIYIARFHFVSDTDMTRVTFKPSHALLRLEAHPVKFRMVNKNTPYTINLRMRIPPDAVPGKVFSGWLSVDADGPLQNVPLKVNFTVGE